MRHLSFVKKPLLFSYEHLSLIPKKLVPDPTSLFTFDTNEYLTPLSPLLFYMWNPINEIPSFQVCAQPLKIQLGNPLVNG